MTIKEITASNGTRDMRGVFCTNDRRKSASEMTTERWLDGHHGNPEIVDDPEAVAKELKAFKAQDFASIWNDGSLGVAVVNGMSDFMARNEVEDIWQKMTWEQQAVVYAAFAYGYKLAKDDLPELH